GRRGQVGVLSHVYEREIVRQQRSLEDARGEQHHRGGRVEGAAPDLDEQRRLPPACPEGEQRRKAAEHEPGEQRAGSEVTEDHDVYGWVEKRDGHLASS